MINCDICTNLGQCSFLTNNEFINKVETYICKFLDLLKLCCFQSKVISDILICDSLIWFLCKLDNERHHRCFEVCLPMF